MSPSPPKKKRRRYKDINSSHKTKTDCPVEGCKMMQKRLDHLKSHYILMVVWDGEGGGEALSLNSGPPSPLSLAPDTEEGMETRS